MSANKILADKKGSYPLAQALAPAQPVLHLSGPKLRAAYERLIAGSERVGGIERFAAAVKLRSDAFRDRFADGKAEQLSRGEFEEIVPLMATVRRRIVPLLDRHGWPMVHTAILELLDGTQDTTTTDNRIIGFENTLARKGQPQGPHPRAPDRFLRDLASEILHNVLPEYYPLMHRWVWDAKANTGVLREIWHDPQGPGDNVDQIVIDTPDGYETFLALRQELSQFLADNGVFRDMLWHVDLLLAQVYGDYISTQGGAWLKTEFGSDTDPLEYTRRIVGLDRVRKSRREIVSSSAREIAALNKPG